MARALSGACGRNRATGRSRRSAPCERSPPPTVRDRRRPRRRGHAARGGLSVRGAHEGVTRRSAWSRRNASDADKPPSAHMGASAPSRARDAASRTSATWWAIPSRAARMTCSRREARLSPRIVPRASPTQRGAPRPVSAGTKRTPPLSGVLASTSSISSGPAIMPSPSRSQVSTSPALRTLPSSRWVRTPPSSHAMDRRRPSCGPCVAPRSPPGLHRQGGSPTPPRTRLMELRPMSLADVHLEEGAGTVGALHVAGCEAAGAEQSRRLVAEEGTQRHLVVADPDRTELPIAPDHLGEHPARDTEQAAEPVAEASGPELRQECPARCRRVAHEEPSRRQTEEGERIEGAAAELAPLRALARAGHLVQEPSELRRREVRRRIGRPVASRTQASVDGSRRSRAHTSSVRRHCHTIAGAIGRPVARSHTTTVSP